MKKPIARVLIALALVPPLLRRVRAQTSSRDLTRVSIEDLMKIEITSASRKEQRADEVPAAVFVITQDDIRRSGMRTLPELFRLVPGVQVAQLTSSNWAVSIRGFNDQFSNKLLVLIDGRSIYTAGLLRRVLGRGRSGARRHRPDRGHSRARRGRLGRQRRQRRHQHRHEIGEGHAGRARASERRKLRSGAGHRPVRRLDRQRRVSRLFAMDRRGATRGWPA